MRHAFPWPVALASVIGCSTAATHPELVARVSQVRIVRDSEAIRGCSFLRAVSATEEPGFTTSSGIVLDAGTPAITMLQLRVQQAGGDTVEVTNSEQTFRAASNRNAGRAQTLTTLTGNAYRCGEARPAATSNASADARRLTTAARSRGWEAFTAPHDPSDSGILAIADDGHTNFRFGCLQSESGPLLYAGLVIDKPAERSHGEKDISIVQLRFGAEPARVFPVIRSDDGIFLQFYENDDAELAGLLATHDSLFARIWFEDGSSEGVTFDVHGFSRAARSTSSGCGSR